MENVEIKQENKPVKKKASKKKVAKKAPAKAADPKKEALVAFMKKRNEIRKRAGLEEAYSQEDIAKAGE